MPSRLHLVVLVALALGADGRAAAAGRDAAGQADDADDGPIEEVTGYCPAPPSGKTLLEAGIALVRAGAAAGVAAAR